MWSDFKIGSDVSETFTYGVRGVTANIEDAYIQINISGNVGTYMGSTTEGFSVRKTDLRPDDEWTAHLNDASDAGGLYRIRIARNSNNNSDYAYAKAHISGYTHTYTPVQDGTNRDKFTQEEIPV